MLPERLTALAVPAGPERRRLLRGETVVLPDGRKLLTLRDAAECITALPASRDGNASESARPGVK